MASRAACGRILSGLEPNVVGAGDGKPRKDANTARQLKAFARNFQPPAHGRYTSNPAITDECGIGTVPPLATDYLRIAAGTLAAGGIVSILARRDKKRGN